jgi:hypothetical protein
MPEVLFIVAWNEPALYKYVRASLADVNSVAVIVDRRRGDRRRQTVQVPMERRRDERRTQDVGRALRGLGWAIVRPERWPIRGSGSGEAAPLYRLAE